MPFSSTLIHPRAGVKPHYEIYESLINLRISCSRRAACYHEGKLKNHKEERIMLNENVKKLLKENMWDLATCSAGVPNVVPVALKT